MYLKASPLPPAPERRSCHVDKFRIASRVKVDLIRFESATGDWQSGGQHHSYGLKTLSLEAWRLHFGILGTHLGDPGVPGDASLGTVGSRCRF